MKKQPTSILVLTIAFLLLVGSLCAQINTEALYKDFAPHIGHVSNLSPTPVSASATSITSASSSIDPDLVAAFEEVIEAHMEAYDMVGISASVIVPNGDIWRGAVGMSTETEPLTPDHKMGTGSLTKSYAAATVLKLREEGLLSLDDTIGTWMAGYANIPGEVTIKQLLNHTSGIYSFTSNLEWEMAVFTDLDSIWDPYLVLSNFVNAPVFAPGTAWQYSNTNYLIAAVIVEMVTGEEFHQVLREYLLEPLELENTYLAPFENAIEPLGHLWYYNLVSGEYVDFTSAHGLDSFTSTAWAAGAIFSDAGDLSVWMKALLTGEVLNAESQDLLMDFVPTGQGVGYNYGLGIHEFNIGGAYAIGHTGDIIYKTASFYFPGADLMISFTTNHGIYDQFIMLLIQQLYDAYEQWMLSLSATAHGLMEELLVYPNPASDYFVIKTSRHVGALMRMYDTSGKQVYEADLGAGLSRVEIAHLPAGLYYVHVASGVVGYAQKVLVTR